MNRPTREREWAKSLCFYDCTGLKSGGAAWDKVVHENPACMREREKCAHSDKERMPTLPKLRITLKAAQTYFSNFYCLNAAAMYYRFSSNNTEWRVRRRRNTKWISFIVERKASHSNSKKNNAIK
jgi:hypothetical protein